MLSIMDDTCIDVEIDSNIDIGIGVGTAICNDIGTETWLIFILALALAWKSSDADIDRC